MCQATSVGTPSRPLSGTYDMRMPVDGVVTSFPAYLGDTVGKNVERAVLASRAKGTGKRKIAKQLGIGVSTVNRILSEAA